MSPGIPTRIIAASCGLSGFAVAIVAGLSAGNPAEDVLIQALIALLACNLLGMAVGTIAERTVRDSISEQAVSPDFNKVSTTKALVGAPGAALHASL